MLGQKTIIFNATIAMSNSGWRRTLLELGFGQLVSFDFAIMAFSASSFTTQVDAPLTMSFSSYVTLALVYGSIMLYRRQKLQVPFYWYALLGFVDLHGNYLVNKAFQFTSITSVTLLNSWTVAWAMLLTWIFLGTKHSIWQFLGAAICVGGLALVLLSDAGEGGGGGSKVILGDFLVVAGTFCFSLSNVGEEFCVKRKDRVEVVAMIGVFGMLVSASEIALFEGQNLLSLKISTELIWSWVTFVVSSFLFYTLVPFALEMSGATLLNLSLLTSGIWAVVFRIFVYKQKVNWLYYLAFSIVVIGIFVYAKTENDPESKQASEDASSSSEHLLMDDQNATP